jgi:hypothetical protein
MKMFSDFAYEKLVALYAKHGHEVGRVLFESNPEKYKSFSVTDCITYALNVIAYAFEQTGDNRAAKQIWKLGKHGTDLSAYLVKTHNWKGVYINPDINHPQDVDSEHSFSHHMAVRTCLYYEIPLVYQVINYSVTAKTHPAFRKLNTRAGQTPLNNIDLASLALVKFGFGVSRGGRHTWLFSQGKVYEVHWDGMGDTLYEASPLRSYPWLSGAIVVPPDQAHHLSVSARLKCGGG